MNWLITGGCGFIGTALIRRLLQEGQMIRIIDDLSVGSCAALGVCQSEIQRNVGELKEWNSLTLIVSDIRDPLVASIVADGADVVVHLAASTGVIPSVENPLVDFDVNARGTITYLEAARKRSVPRFVFASSGAPLGSQVPPLHENLAPRPLSPYGASKLAGEGYCSAYWGSYGLETVALRFGNIYGPGSQNKQSVIAKFIKQVLAGDALTIYGDGTQTRDYVFVDDIVEAIMRAASIPDIGGQLFQIATSREHTVSEVLEIIVGELAQIVEKPIRVTHAAARAGEVIRNYSDTSKAEKMMGFTAKVDLPVGIPRTIQFFMNNSLATLR